MGGEKLSVERGETKGWRSAAVQQETLERIPSAPCCPFHSFFRAFHALVPPALASKPRALLAPRIRFPLIGNQGRRSPPILLCSRIRSVVLDLTKMGEGFGEETRIQFPRNRWFSFCHRNIDSLAR